MSPVTVTGAALVSSTRLLAEPVSLFDHLDGAGFVWLCNGAGFVASGEVVRIEVGPGPDRFEEAAARLRGLLANTGADGQTGLPGTGPIAVGALPFDDRSPGELVVPARVVGLAPDGRAWITDTSLDGSGAADVEPSPKASEDPGAPSSFAVRPGRRSRGEWLASVEAALERIAEGRLEKVVLARDVVVEADAPFSLPAVVSRLAARYPSCFVFSVGGFLGATPELLVERRGAVVTSRPMAGTAVHSTGAGLHESVKERREHALVVEAVAAALAPRCDEITVPTEPETEQLSNVAHLAATVTGRLADPPLSALALAGLLHPTPAVAGTPVAAALSVIDELEGLDRGPYAGPVGWVDGRGDGQWAVALRCAQVAGSRARLFAGSGIVAGSDPESEWAETQAKFEPMLGALVRP